MSLKAITVKLRNLDSLVDNPIGSQLTATEEFDLLDPRSAFARDDMLNLQSKVGELVSEYNLTSFPSLLTIGDLDPEDLSEIVTKFLPSSIVTSDTLTIDDLNLIDRSINQYTTAGGSFSLVNLSRIAQDFDDLSFDGVDLSSLSTQFAGSVTTSVSDIISAGSATAKSISQDVVTAAETQYNNITAVLEDLNQSNSVSITDISSIVAQGEREFVSVANAKIDQIVSTLPESISSLPTIVAAEVDKVHAEVALTITSSLQIANSINANEFSALSPTQKTLMHHRLKDRITLAKLRSSNTVAATITSQAAGAVKRFKENNPAADEATVAQYSRNIISQGATSYNACARANQSVVTRAKRSTALYQDIRRSSDDRSFIAGQQGGREIIDREDLATRIQTFDIAEKWTPEKFAPSRYRTAIVKQLHSLNRKVAPRYAGAIVEVIETMFDLGYDITITSGFRSIAKQRALYREKKPLGLAVATPGNSWHNYGLAADIGLFLNGKYIRTPGPYVGFAREIFAKYGLHNPIRNDSLHFQPVELSISPRSIKSTLVASNGALNNRAIEKLIG